MKLSGLILAATLGATSVSAATIYEENFDGQDDKGAFGTTVDTSGVSWSIDLGDAALFNDSDFFGVFNGVFAAQDTNVGCPNSSCSGVAGSNVSDFDLPTWLSPVIDISAYTNLVLSVDVGFLGDITRYEFDDFVNSGDTGVVTGLVDNAPDVGLDILGTATNGTVGAGVSDGGTFQFSFVANTYAGNERIFIDNIVLTGDLTAVPLPASGLMLLGAMGGMAAWRRRKG
jgi:hypothetical protein